MKTFFVPRGFDDDGDGMPNNPDAAGPREGFAPAFATGANRSFGAASGRVGGVSSIGTGTGAIGPGGRGSKPPPDSYTCNACNKKGHWIQQCPEKRSGYGGYGGGGGGGGGGGSYGGGGGGGAPAHGVAAGMRSGDSDSVRGVCVWVTGDVRAMWCVFAISLCVCLCYVVCVLQYRCCCRPHVCGVVAVLSSLCSTRAIAAASQAT